MNLKYLGLYCYKFEFKLIILPYNSSKTDSLFDQHHIFSSPFRKVDNTSGFLDFLWSFLPHRWSLLEYIVRCLFIPTIRSRSYLSMRLVVSLLFAFINSLIRKKASIILSYFIVFSYFLTWDWPMLLMLIVTIIGTISTWSELIFSAVKMSSLPVIL